MRFRWGIFITLSVLAGVLTACSLIADEEKSTPEPTPGTPVAGATLYVGTNTPDPTKMAGPTETHTPAQTITLEPTEFSIPEPTATTSSAVIPGNTNTPTTTPSMTPPPSLTPLINMTATPLVTPIITLPQPTSASMSTVTSAPTTTPFRTFAPPPTFTPAIWASPTPIATSAIPTAQPTLEQPTQETVTGGAVVCATCGNLRLRTKPGTAGNVVTYLDANTPVTIIGRTEDNVWLQITLDNGMMGWVSAQYLDIGVDLSLVAITGVAEDTAFPTTVPIVDPNGIEVVTGISSHARQIFLDGRAKGNSAHTFSRVGDSITASPFFLSSISSGAYSLGEYAYLGGAINFFSGPNGRGLNPFGAPSMAAQNGWSTESVLNPAQADRNLCRVGETPLECEYRVVKPAVALIMLGTNDSGGLPTSQYTANLHRIVEISINMGVIPVLSTIPPKHYDSRTDGRVAEFNQIIIATARAYDIPLWNYFAVMLHLPAEGLSSDGVHPSIPPSGSSIVLDANNLKFGYAVRNLTALQVLYALWQQVLYDGDTAIPATAPPIVNTPAGGDTGTDGGTDSGTCLGALPPRLVVGGQGRVTPGAPNKLRNAPTLTGTQIGNIPGEGVFSVVGGPQCADGFLWWQVIYQGVTGWTANGDGTIYWIEPYP